MYNARLLKLIFCTVLLAGGIGSSPARARILNKPEDTAPPTEDVKKKEGGIKDQFAYSFNDVANNLVIIECQTCIGRMAGSGFIAKTDGKTYIYTNQHVIMGMDRFVKLATVTGEELRPTGVELSRKRDIARLQIDDREDALVISRNLAMDIPLAVFGNSEGGGVATELYGKVTGVGSDLVEVTAEFVSGNSGSPVLNLDREVIGIASYVQFSAPSEEKKDTKFENKVRRFCYRLTDVEFMPVNWGRYNAKYGKPYLVTENTIESMAAIIDGWYDAPFDRVPSENYPDISLVSWSTTHNKMVDRVNGILHKGYITRAQQSKLRDEVYASAHSLANISHRMALEIGNQADDPALTEFLHDEFESDANGLEFASQVLDYVGQKVADYIDNL